MKFENPFDKTKLPSWMNKIQGGFSLLQPSSSTSTSAHTNTNTFHEDEPVKKNDHRVNIIKTAFKLAPFMRLHGRHGKLF